jgi:hypothetical protein
VGAGFDPQVFWRTTPRLAMIAIEERRHQTHNADAWLAWTTAALGRVKPKKFPRLKSLLSPRRRRRRQTWQEQLALARAWVASAGTLRHKDQE